jgi:arabinogalactan endo-1,4-beta-galactosidase
MSNENKIGCFFGQLSLDEKEPYQRYNSLTKCAINSFKKFHPDIEVIHVTNDNMDEFLNRIGEDAEFYNHSGLVRFILAEKAMRKLGFSKMIVLGIDTITCARLDEFLEDNTTDVLATLNYPCVEVTPYWTTPVYEFQDTMGTKFFDFYNLNSDVTCFNNVKAFKRINDLAIEHFSPLAEQSALNEIAIVEKTYNMYTMHVQKACMALV